jgi:hypothetical protein
MAGAAALALLAGCSTASPNAPVQTPAATPYQRLSGIPMDRAVAYTKVQAELRDFLDLWRAKGYAEASKAYLVLGEQADPSDDVPMLASGQVVKVNPDDWTSTDLFVVSVDFDLTFSGNTGAWGNGTNSRFVTATARAGAIPYVLEFATSR